MALDFLFGNGKNTDSLTGVYSREVLVEYVNFLVSGNVPFSLAIIDIDNFKYVNDAYGHTAGDNVLAEVAGRIKDAVGDSGTVGRFGGDEFLVVYPDITAYDEVWQQCRKIMTIMNGCEIHQIPGLYVSVTIGLSRFPENETAYEGLLETADKALYRGKNKGRNCFIIYLPEKHAQLELKSEKDKTLSSMYLHSMVFRLITKNENVAEGIKNLFGFLMSYFMIDHLCIQAGDKIYFEKVHNLSAVKKFAPIDLSLITRNISASKEIFYVNQMDALMSSSQTELCSQYVEQRIKASFACEVLEQYNGSPIMLRAESTSKRVWQYGEMDILLTSAKLIGLMLTDKKLQLQ